MNNIQVMPNVTINKGDERRKYKNMMIQQGLDWLLDLAAGLAPSGLSHIAVGDGTRVVSLGDLQLENERARKPITAIAKDNGAAIAEVFFDKDEALFHWKEIGLYVGGTDTPNSGKLVARALVEEIKDNRRTATVSWEIGFQNL
jgi:hypothetical protein